MVHTLTLRWLPFPWCPFAIQHNTTHRPISNHLITSVTFELSYWVMVQVICKFIGSMSRCRQLLAFYSWKQIKQVSNLHEATQHAWEWYSSNDNYKKGIFHISVHISIKTAQAEGPLLRWKDIIKLSTYFYIHNQSLKCSIYTQSMIVHSQPEPHKSLGPFAYLLPWDSLVYRMLWLHNSFHKRSMRGALTLCLLEENLLMDIQKLKQAIVKLHATASYSQ